MVRGFLLSDIINTHKNNRNKKMFTVKFLNYTTEEEQCNGALSLQDCTPELMSVYLREYQSLEVWLPHSQNYIDEVERLKEDTKANRRDDMSDEELDVLVSMQEEYKAFITYESSGENYSYCVAANEKVFITDSNGNTVHSI